MSDEQNIGKKLTPKKRQPTMKEAQKLFLDSFSQNANVMLSARSAGVSRTTVYNWLEHDQDFTFAYNQAKEDAKDTLRAEIYRRGKEGWDEDVYQLGKFAGTVRKYDTTLLIFHAKMLMPEYREKQQLELTGTNGGPVQFQHLQGLTDQELDTLEQIAQQAQEREQASGR